MTWFFPALALLVGAHYLPFVFLYGMRMFAVLGALLVVGGMLISRFWPNTLSAAAWYSAVILLVFAVVGRTTVMQERRRSGAAGSARLQLGQPA